MADLPEGAYLASTVCYQDPKAALRWLEDAFGFEPSLVVLNDQDQLVHSEMRFGASRIMVGGEAPPSGQSPASIGGVNTQKVHAQLTSGLDEHCARARAAGALILREPETMFYGDRNYVAADPEGHVWSFGQTINPMTQQDWETTGGVTVRERLQEDGA